MKIEDEIKGRFRNEYHKGLINLIFTAKKLNQRFSSVLKIHEITEAQYNVLRILRGNRQSTTSSIGYIKERMLDRNSDVSRIVDKLYGLQYIDRKECPNDRRQKEVSITEKGLELLLKMDGSEKQVDTFLKNLNDSEIKALNKLMDKIRD
ncbi:MAG: MarR family transcriptional regulator [Bacteroidetes bacterium]|nr:MAG: MarR family transcriptional regulator [Bacteroidota bacterium]